MLDSANVGIFSQGERKNRGQLRSADITCLLGWSKGVQDTMSKAAKRTSPEAADTQARVIPLKRVGRKASPGPEKVLLEKRIVETHTIYGLKESFNDALASQGITFSELGKRARMSSVTITRFFQQEKVDWDTLERLANAIGYPITHFLEACEKPTGNNGG